MEMSEAVLERWLERSGKFFRTLARNPVVRAVLLSRGLTDEELKRGWDLYAKINGFSGGAPAHAATPETTAAQAMDELDAWDAPAYRATKAILQVRYPEVERFLFENLEASTGSAAVAGVERFLDRITALRTGKAEGINAKVGKAAVELLATRKALDPEREARLRTLVQTVRLGARPEEVISGPEVNPGRAEAAEALIAWLHEWREVARMSISRRSYRISLGLANRRQGDDSGEETPDEETPPATTPRASVSS